MLDRLGEQPGRGIGADENAHVAEVNERTRHFGAAYSVTEPVAGDGQSNGAPRVARCIVRAGGHLMRPSLRRRALSAFSSSSIGSTFVCVPVLVCGPTAASTRCHTSGSSSSAP